MTIPRPWIARATLTLATALFILIGSKYVLAPVSAAAESGLAFTTLVGQTNMRAGVGGFALGCAIITLVCLVSPNRLRAGLWFIAGMVAPVLLVRLYGVVADGTFEANRRIVIVETALLALATTGLAITRKADGGAGGRFFVQPLNGADLETISDKATGS